MSQASLKNKLAKKDEEKKGPSPAAVMAKVIEGQLPQFARVLPKGLDADRLARIALTEMRTNPDLALCTKESVLGALMSSAQLGLEPGILGQCHLVPFRNTRDGTRECQLIVGYRGIIDLSYRSGMVKNIDARAVHQNDEFDYEYGLDQFLRHKPTSFDRGEPVQYYALVEMTTGGRHFHVMSKLEVEQHRDKFAKGLQKKSSPWNTDFDAMAKKTCVRQMEAFLPKSVELAQAFQFDGVTRSTSPSTGEIEPIITTPLHEVAAMAEEEAEAELLEEEEIAEVDDDEVVEAEIVDGEEPPSTSPSDSGDDDEPASPAEQTEAMSDEEKSEEPFLEAGEEVPVEESPEPEAEDEPAAEPEGGDDEESETFPVESPSEEVGDDDGTAGEEDEGDGKPKSHVDDDYTLSKLERELAVASKPRLLELAEGIECPMDRKWSAARMRNALTAFYIEAGLVADG